MLQQQQLAENQSAWLPIPALTANHDDQSHHDKLERPLLSIVIAVHLFIIALGILGNALIIYLVVVNIQLRNARNAFMLNLTFSNLLLVGVCTPSFLVSIASPGWPMGSFWCKFLHSVQIVIVLVSAFSIAMIAIDRWIFVVYARSKQLTTTHVVAIVIGIWSLAIALSVPTFLSRSTGQIYDDSFFSMIKDLELKMADWSPIADNSSAYAITETKKPDFNPMTGLSILQSKLSRANVVYCFESWPQPIYKRVYILVLFVLEFVLPCLTMLVTYMWIIRFLKLQDDKMNHYELLHKRLVQKERHHQKNCKVLSVLCVTFIICCLPLSFFNIKAEFEVGKYMEGEPAHQKGIYLSLTLLTTLEELNAILSPLLYGWMNHNFRNAINDKLDAIKGRIKTNRKINNKEQFLVNV